jgi:hypothetical protein
MPIPLTVLLLTRAAAMRTCMPIHPVASNASGSGSPSAGTALDTT